MGALREIAALRKMRVLQLLAVVALFAVVGGAALYEKYCVLDPDIWWHMKVGDWVLEHKAVPHTAIFSHTAAQRPWTAYSWAYEVMLSRAYAWFGLVGIGVFGLLLTCLVAVALFIALLRIARNFWLALLLTALGCHVFLFSLMPRPVFFSMALCTAVLTMLIEAERSKDIRPLYWLPLLFVFWANVHIQFTYGFAVLGLFVTVEIVERLFSRFAVVQDHIALQHLPLAKLLLILVGCFLGSCVGPYSYHLFQVLAEYSKAKVTYAIIIELLPLDFQSVSHYTEVLLTGGAFVALGWNRKVSLFRLALMVAAAVLAFRTTRDAWFVCVPALLIIADAARSEDPDSHFRVPEIAGAAAALALVLLLIARNTDFNTRGLDDAISNWYPVNAANYLRRNPAPGPIFNSFDWGGFLIWYLPQYPVSVDGRNDAYGDQLDTLLYNTESGQPGYEDDPYLKEAGVVLLRKRVPLAKLLTVNKNFRVYYQDEQAVIFVRRESAP